MIDRIRYAFRSGNLVSDRLHPLPQGYEQRAAIAYELTLSAALKNAYPRAQVDVTWRSGRGLEPWGNGAYDEEGNRLHEESEDVEQIAEKIFDQGKFWPKRGETR